jgi:NADPH2:quinone reductase
MKAIRQYEFGGPEQLQFEERADPEPGPGQVRIAVEVSGVHLIDTSIRQGAQTGAFPLPSLPMTPGREVAGTIESLGPDVDGAWRGRRVVVHLGLAGGGYASMAVANVADLFPLADHVGAAEAVAMVGTGRTALGILEAAELTSDDIVLVTAASGGVGALLVQGAKRAGATVVGVAGGEAKVETVTKLGADIAIDSSVGEWAPEPWSGRVRAALGDRTITVALDGVGGEAGRAAFELVAPGGRMIVFGWASGSPMRLGIDDLMANGVRFTPGIGARVVTRPGGIRGLAADALDALATARLTPLVHPPFPLADAADAHREIESRATMGKVVLVP